MTAERLTLCCAVAVIILWHCLAEIDAQENKTALPLHHHGRQALVLLGGTSDRSGHVTVLNGTTICSSGSIPALPATRKALFAAAVGDRIIACGGREHLLDLETECWSYRHGYKSWVSIDSLPRSVAGAAAAAVGQELWVFGGVVEEEYYQGDNSEYYYDYVTEETGDGIYVLDGKTEKWTDRGRMPMPIQSACALPWDEYILVIGGKDNDELAEGSREVRVFDTITGSWDMNSVPRMTVPRMTVPRYNHGCGFGTIGGRFGIVIAGGRGPHCKHGNNTAEFLELSDGLISDKLSWESLPDLVSPHPNNPAVAMLDGQVIVAGGGGYPFVGGEEKIEILDGVRWLTFNALKPGRSFGTSALVPQEIIPKCEMEPNLGIHRYHQKKKLGKLQNKKWFCVDDLLIFSDQTKNPSWLDCTVPGCHYPEQLASRTNFEPPKQVVRGGWLSCRLDALGQPRQKVVCELTCRDGWMANGGIEATTCMSSLASGDRLRWKVTNFTSDYLECVRTPNNE